MAPALPKTASKKPPTSADLFSELREALVWNHPEKVKALLAAGADPLAENEESAQLLSHAATGGNPDLVKLMISLGCDPEHRDCNKRTPLHCGAYSGNAGAASALIEAGADIHAADARGQTPLTDALRSNHAEAAAALIKQGADLTVSEPREKRSPLMQAASMKSLDLVQLLLDKGCDLEAKDFNGCTPLMYAARSGSPEITAMLLAAGAQINATDTRGKDALSWCSSLSPETSSLLLLGKSVISPGAATKALLKAAADGHMDTMKLLLEKKAAIQPEKEGGESALVSSVLHRCPDALQMLLAHPSVQVNYRAGPRLRTALITAAKKGDQAKVRMLLDAGADPGLSDADNRQAAHHAAGSAKIETLNQLKDRGSDLLAPAPGGRSLLHLAIYDTESFAKVKDRLETSSWLLDAGLDPDQPDGSGITPLMLAALHARKGIVDLLIAAGADSNRKDKEGRTALYHAISFGTDYGYNDRYARPRSKASDKAAAIITALLEAGADPNSTKVLADAARWRWPGAVGLLKKFRAEEPP